MHQKMITEEELDAMTPDEVVSLIVATAHGESKFSLPPACDLVDLVELGAPIASSYWVQAVDPESLDVETICEALADSATKERLQEIENGDELDYHEQLKVACRCTRSSRWDGGTTTEYYKIVDSKGRAAFFSEDNQDDVGIYGPSGGWDGPFADLPHAHDCEEQDEEGNISVFCLNSK
jgi:hypothetical protein